MTTTDAQQAQATQVLVVRKVKQLMPGVFDVHYTLPDGSKRRISIAPTGMVPVDDAIRDAIAAEHVQGVVIAMDPGVGW